jgi:molybdate transport repressor ModE-like protein
MLEWDHLRIVLAIHRKGSMQAAAEDLGIDRATVLRRLDALEARLKASLFDRRHDGCVLTEAGHAIIATVEGIEQAMTAIEHRVSGRDREAEGAVSVALPEFLAAKILAPELPRFAKLHPGITVEVISGNGLMNLTRGEADIALRNRRPDHNTLVSRHAGTAGLGFFASRDYLASRGDPARGLGGHDFVLFDSSLANVPSYTQMEDIARHGRIVMRSNEILPMVAAAKAGLGLAFLPCIAAHGEPGLSLVAPGIVAEREMYLVTHRDLLKRTRVRLVFDLVVRICAENAAALAGKLAVDLMDGRQPSFNVNEAALLNS